MSNTQQGLYRKNSVREEVLYVAQLKLFCHPGAKYNERETSCCKQTNITRGAKVVIRGGFQSISTVGAPTLQA